MKLHNNENDSFIITSNDILVNGNKTDVLTNVINEQDDKLTNLERNVKWLYKYGGTGSKGSGGTGGNASSFTVDASVLFGNTIIQKSSNQKIILSNSNKTYETLSITLNKANILNIYQFKITGFSNSYSNKWGTLTQDDDYAISFNVPIDDTGIIKIELKGTNTLTGDTDNTTYLFTYIKNPYAINLSIVGNDNINKSILDADNLYVNDAIEKGVNLYIDYNIVSSKQISYEIICDEAMLTNYEGIINDSEHGIGLGSLLIPFNQSFIKNDSNYGFHTINIKFKIDPDESLGISNGQIISKDISFTYIPYDQIFFKIESVNSQAKIYKYSDKNYNNAITNFNLYKNYYEYFKTLENEQSLDPIIREDVINTLVDESLRNSITDSQLKDVIENKLDEIESELYIFNVGSLQLYIQAYKRSNTLNTVDVSYILNDGNTEINNELLSSLQYRKRQMINIPIHEEGVYKLCIYSNQQTEQQRIYYYFAAFDKNSGINWYNTDVEFNDIDLYYREGKIGAHNEYRGTPDLLNRIKKYESIQKIQKYANGLSSQLFDVTDIVNQLQQPECDVMLSFGIQYSYINNDSAKLMSILTNNSSSSLNIDIYQNKITTYNSGNTLANIFIPKEHDYAPSNNNKYHLLTLYKRYVYETTSPYYEIIIYIDGCPEAAFKNFINDPSCWSSVLLNNVNFSLNFFELACFKHNKDSQNRFDKNEVSGTVEQHPLTYLDDIAIAEYYYKYTSSRKNLSNIISLLPNLRNFKETDYGMIEVVSKNDIDAIANNIDIPVLLLEYTEQSENEFVNWFTTSYKETELSKDKKKLDYIYYSSGLNKLSQINLPDELSGSYWYAALQGSSTGELFDKNLTLGIDSTGTENRMGIFTPNFYDIDQSLFTNSKLTTEEQEIVNKAKNSFLPETAYTLKADVVDSSHSNNTAIGAFVNANTTPFNILFDNGNTNKGNNKYINYIKNCLLGFPVLIFANINYNGKSTYYFLGIYNFNLGRDSYFNMGYYSPRVLQEQEQITSALHNASGKDFIVTYVEFTNTDMQALPVDDGVIVAEIQGGKEYFDFSQYDSTMLLPQELSQGAEDSGCMFGDFVPKYDPSKSTNADLRIRYHIPRLVEAIAKAGGYLFDKVLHKHLGEYTYRYNKYIDKGFGSSIFDSANQVPNYKLQYIRNPQEGDPDLQYVIHNFQKDDNGQIKLVNGQPIIDPKYISDDPLVVGRLLDTHVDEGFDPYQRGFDPILDYISLTEYYTACMGFGLVDSVMKNLNVKSWNATYTGSEKDDETGKWYIAFYDMDTSFGRDNGGAKTSYFAFSDYWKTNKTAELEQPTIYRDFYPMADPSNDFVKGQSMSEAGFDIPSSYLFAVAKYAHLLNDDKSGSLLVPKSSIPNNIWARWRCISSNLGDISGPGAGELRSADYFIQKYFIRNLDEIPEQIWALNYRLKYLKRITPDPTNKYNYTYSTEENGSFENLNYIPFHGKGINELYEWLGGRIHILDSYFNLEGNANLSIKYLEYTENDSLNGNLKFTPIIKSDSIQGYKYNDLDTPNMDSTGNYKWLPTGFIDTIPNIDSNILGSNKDIEILKDIFSTTGNGGRYSQPIDLYVKANALSPFNMTTGMTEKFKYLLEDPNLEYHIYYKPNGAVVIKFGGSTLWTYIRDLNTIINENTLTLITENLDQITLTKGRCNAYNISTMKSLKTVSIIKDLYDNDSNFSGELTFALDANNTDPYPDLTSITLIRTGITLTCNGVSVSDINLSNTTSGDTNIINCSNLSSVVLDGFTCESTVTIMPGWSNDMSINNSKIKTLKLTPKDKTAARRKLTINNDKYLTNITLNDFTDITISNCPNLNNICILNPEQILSLNIIQCNNTNNHENLFIHFNENDDYISSETLDLRRFTSLNTFNFNGTYGFKIIDISQTDGEEITINGTTYKCIRLYDNAFENTLLEKIITNHNVYLYLDTTSNAISTFANSSYGADPNPLIISGKVQLLNGLFKRNIAVNNSIANITPGFVADFLNCKESTVIFENIENITSLCELFYGQSNVTNNNEAFPINLGKFVNVNNISYMFFSTSISYAYKNMFGDEISYCGKNVIESNKEFNLACFIPTGCKISLNLFDFYINNIETLISDNDSISYSLEILNTYDTINISDIFTNLKSDNKLKTFRGFNFHANNAINYDGLLYNKTTGIKFPQLQSIINSFTSLNDKSYNFNSIGLNKINLSNLTLKNSFNFSKSSIGRIIIDEVIDFNSLKDNDPVLPWHSECNSLNGPKQIDEKNIINVLTILHQKKCKILDNLFANTSIIVDESKQNKNELILSNLVDGDSYIFQKCIGLFENAKLVSEDYKTEYGFEITNQTLRSFTKVVNWKKAFKGCTLHKNLPLNMFNQKNLAGQYTISNYCVNSNNAGFIGDLSEMFANTKLDSNISWFEHNWTDDDINNYNNGVKLNGSYHANIKTRDGAILSNYKAKDIYTTEDNTQKIYGEHIVHNLILPWDIFYACTSNCDISGFISNSEFEGILPEKLFPVNSRISTLIINNVFNNVLVIPNYFNDIVISGALVKNYPGEKLFTQCPAYVFVPKWFTKTSYLTNGFNFKLLLPNSGALIYNPNTDENSIIQNNNSVELYFLLQADSINIADMISLKDFLPYDTTTQYYDELDMANKYLSLHHLDNKLPENEGKDFNVKNNYDIHYYLYLDTNTNEYFNILSNDNEDVWQVTKTNDGEGNEITTWMSLDVNDTDTGLPLSGNMSLLYKSIFNVDIIVYGSGYLLNKGCNLGLLAPTGDAEYLSKIDTPHSENNVYVDISPNIKFPLNERAGSGYYEKVLYVPTNASSFTLEITNITNTSQTSFNNYNAILGII